MYVRKRLRAAWSVNTAIQKGTVFVCRKMNTQKNILRPLHKLFRDCSLRHGKRFGLKVKRTSGFRKNSEAIREAVE